MNRRSFLGLLGLVGIAPKVAAKAITPPHFPATPDLPPPWTPPDDIAYYEAMGDILVSGEIAYPGDRMTVDDIGRIRPARVGEHVVGVVINKLPGDAFVMRLK